MMRPEGRGGPYFLITSPDWSSAMIQVLLTRSANTRMASVARPYVTYEFENRVESVMGWPLRLFGPRLSSARGLPAAGPPGHGECRGDAAAMAGVAGGL